MRKHAKTRLRSKPTINSMQIKSVLHILKRSQTFWKLRPMTTMTIDNQNNNTDNCNNNNNNTDNFNNDNKDQDQRPPLRRSTRVRRQPVRYGQSIPSEQINDYA